MENLWVHISALRNRPTLVAGSHFGTGDTFVDMPTAVREILQGMQLLADGDRPVARLLRRSEWSEIFQVQLAWGTICLKRSLGTKEDASLRDRSQHEYRWLRVARAVIGEAVPEPLAEYDGCIAIDCLDPDSHPSWLTQLRDGDASPSTAAEIGRLIGRLHAGSANNFAVAEDFDTGSVFDRRRLQPLLLAVSGTALQERVHPLIDMLVGNRVALIHGEFVPDNILIGRDGPVFVDADCAKYGDPAFDLACCLTPLLLLSRARPQSLDHYLTCFDAMCAAYLQRVNWEAPEALEQRAAALVPLLLLASLAEYEPIALPHGTRDRDLVLAYARNLLNNPLIRLAAVRESWRRSF